MTKQIKLNENATMTSLEIADLMNGDKKEGEEEVLHKNVLASIRNTLEAAEINVLSFQHVYKTGLNKGKVKYYILPRMECDLVISGYSVKYRAAIIKRWHELETQAASRLSARLGAKFQHKALGAALYLERGKETPSYIYSNESNMFNAIILGMTAKKYKEINSLDKNEAIRDHMTPFQLEAVEELQFMDANMIKRGWNYAERKNKLTLHYNENLLRIEGKELEDTKTKANKELARHHLKAAKALLAK